MGSAGALCPAAISIDEVRSTTGQRDLRARDRMLSNLILSSYYRAPGPGLARSVLWRTSRAGV
jgi:hypothetical protein